MAVAETPLISWASRRRAIDPAGHGGDRGGLRCSAHAGHELLARAADRPARALVRRSSAVRRHSLSAPLVRDRASPPGVRSPRDGRRRSSLRSRGRQARRAIGPAGHGVEGGRDRPAVRVDVALRERWSRPPGMARRRCLPSGPRLIHVRSRGWRSTAATTTRWCSCDTSRPRSTASNRSRPRCSPRCRAPGDPLRANRVPTRRGARWGRLSARWCWCSTISTSSPTRPVWTCSPRWSSTFRPARRSRSPAGKTRHSRLPAGGRTAWSTRSAWRTFGWTSRRPGCCLKLPESSCTRTRCPR